jgi:hypothetical protein
LSGRLFVTAILGMAACFGRFSAGGFFQGPGYLFFCFIEEKGKKDLEVGSEGDTLGAR